MEHVFKSGFGSLILPQAGPIRLPEALGGTLPDISTDGVLVADLRQPDCPLVYVNSAFENISGYSSREVIGKNCRYLQGSDRLQPEIEAIRQAIGSRSGIDVTLRNYRKDGTMFWNELRLVPFLADRGEPTHYIGLIRDVTHGKLAADRAAASTRHDLLTGTLNRYAFVEDVARLLVEKRLAMVLKVDVKSFSDINVGYGFDVGDEVLKQVAKRLGTVGMALISRVGSNEFALALPLKHGDDAPPSLAAIRSVLTQPYRVSGATIKIRFAIGFVLADAASDMMTVVRQAGAALQRSKRSLFLDVCEFNAEDDLRARNRLRMTSEMHQALANGEFIFHYQPKVDLMTEQVVGAEALLRWDHSLFGMQQPAKFISHAEDTGLILDIGAHCLRTVAAQAVRINAGRSPQLNFSLNTSAIEFMHRDMPHFVSDILAETGADPRWITLELTESLMAESSPEMFKVLERMRELGLGLSIDDFGTGYANLRYLEDFPITELKIDRSFVRGLSQSRSKQIIVEAIIRLSDELGFQVVAEGVETAEEHALLKEMKCRFGQGFLFGEPIDGTTLAQLVPHSPILDREE